MRSDLRTRRAAERLIAWLAARFDEDGVAHDAPDNVQFYYKLPAIFARGGRYKLAHRVLAQFETRFLASGDFVLADDPVARPWRAYLGGWLCWGACVLGRFDAAAVVVRAVAQLQDEETGGFWHEEAGMRAIDSERTSAAAMGCVWAGEIQRASAACAHLEAFLSRQTDPLVFYAYSDLDGNPLARHDDRNLYFARKDAAARPALFATTLASFVWLHRRTGEPRWLDVAERYMRIILNHDHDGAALPLATKTGWAALMLHRHRPDPAYTAFACRNADDIVARQKEDGSIDFDEVIDVAKPLESVWQIGWGCDCALTLLAVADREA